MASQVGRAQDTAEKEQKAGFRAHNVAKESGRPLNVLINTLAVPSIRQGGAGFFTAMLIDALSGRSDLSTTVLANLTVKREVNEFAQSTKIEVAKHVHQRPLGKAVNYLQALREPTRLNLGFDFDLSPEFDIVHWPIAVMHSPALDSADNVVMVHDLQHEVYPEFFSLKERLLRRMRWDTAIANSDWIITCSRFNKEMICERHDVPSDRVTVVPLAVRHTLRESSNPDSKVTDGGLEHEGPVFIYPASPLPNKNHNALLKALAAYNSRHSPKARLLLTGPTMHTWHRVNEAIKATGTSGFVDQLGHVSDDELLALYEQVTALIFPSLFEGFGLPALEAMAAGCPVAVADAGSLPEVVGDAGYVFDPHSVDAILEALERLASLSETERADLIAKQRERASTFSLERMASETVDVYRALRS